MVTATGIRPKDIARRYRVSEKWVRELARQTVVAHRPRARWTWRDWQDPDLQPLLQRLENGEGAADINEWDVTLSRKNQITLPVAALRKLNVKSGDQLRAVIKGRTLKLLPHPISWADYYAGIAEGLYGQTDEDIESYIRESRGDWEPLE